MGAMEFDTASLHVGSPSALLAFSIHAIRLGVPLRFRLLNV